MNTINLYYSGKAASILAGHPWFLPHDRSPGLPSSSAIPSRKETKLQWTDGAVRLTVAGPRRIFTGFPCIVRKKTVSLSKRYYAPKGGLSNHKPKPARLLHGNSEEIKSRPGENSESRRKSRIIGVKLFRMPRSHRSPRFFYTKPDKQPRHLFRNKSKILASHRGIRKGNIPTGSKELFRHILKPVHHSFITGKRRSSPCYIHRC